jgi:tRNA1(Val) A37 N6-methylase TrmN6
MSKTSDKKNKGQFYTTNSDYILEGLFEKLNSVDKIIEPFGGKGDLVDWLKKKDSSLNIEAYDIDPKKDYIIKKDTLLSPPNYENAHIITNPPYLARNKCKNKEIYDKYNTNDLYKCFIKSFIN